MSEVKKFVPAGLSPPEQTVGLTGLVPFEIVTPAPARLRPGPGTLRVWIDLPAGWTLHSGTPLVYRVYGGEAGLEFDRNGQIVNVAVERLPLELPYDRRTFPEAPPEGQMALDLTFRYRNGNGVIRVQDVQWRQAIVWDSSGGRTIELRFAAKP